MRMIDSNESNTYRVTTASLELFNLPNKIANNSIDLLDHSLCQYLRFGFNFDRCNGSASNKKALLNNCHSAGYDLSKGTISSASWFSNRKVTEIHDTFVTMDLRDASLSAILIRSEKHSGYPRELHD